MSRRGAGNLLGARGVSAPIETIGALLTNDLYTEYRDLLHALIDGKPGGREALVDFHNRRADESDLEGASMAARRGGDPQSARPSSTAPRSSSRNDATRH